MEKTKTIINAIAVFALVIMLYVTFITEFRICEVKDSYGNIQSIKCSEVSAFEK
jgi:hypothetical protein